MSKKTMQTVSMIISIIAIILSIAAIAMVSGRSGNASAPEEADIQYVLYLGTNGKESNQPVFPPEEAKAEAEKILLDHFGGFTIQEANGGWIDDGTVYREYTLVIYLSDTDLEQVHAASDELIKKFDQSSILIQANETTTEFYSGSN